MKLKLLTIGVMLLSICVMAQEKPQGLKVNDTAPEFSAKDQFGKEVSLKSLLKKGPVVVMFYRGQWCPYCNKQLSGMQDSLEMVTSKGATVLAITPEKQENISKTIEKTKASFPILYDDGLKIMKSYQVAFQLDEASIEKFKGYGIDLNEANGSNGASLPVPALYIINKNGKITYRHFDPDYTKRPSVKEIASHL
ncbi:MAG: peroxiredoxin-like family protein [Chryseolinea sp.]